MNTEVEIRPTFEEARNWNASVNFEDLQVDSNFAFLLCSLICGMIWIIYITYYNSRVIGYIVTRLLTKFYVKKGYLNVGSFTVCALSGKIMFRDIVYITQDYTIRIQDGWLIFRWWRSYVPKDVSEDLSHSDTRLSVMLNGLELHIYNRCSLYSKLEGLFGLDPAIIPWDQLSADDDVEAQKHSIHERQEVSIGKSWRDLIPVIKADISCGRFVFGNRLIPTTLSICVEEAHCMYSTKPAASRLDHFMHFVKCKAENFKVMLAPSPKYTGIADDPPRYMGAGFVVFSSNKIELYYYMDEPGVVPQEPEMLELANGDIVESAPPIWGVDIKCGKGTDFSYGPWADRQREHLYKFFYPPDYQSLKVSKCPMPGEKRQVQSFDIRLSTLHESSIDVLFTKNKETNAVHVNVGPGSYLEVTMPWIVGKDGFTTKITGQLLHIEATTSLQFRSLAESETLEFILKCHYPLRWNGHQEWLLNLTGCKATGWFSYAHKEFFQDLIYDWSSRSKADLLHFIPYTWKITVLLKEFEILFGSNEFNWVDCSSQNQENCYLAVCGDLFDFSFDLPFDDFLPATLPIRFWIQGEGVELCMYIPEVYTSRSILLSLEKNAKIFLRDGSISHHRPVDNGKKWRNICSRSTGWIDFWTIPIAALSICYTYHPIPPFGPPPQADITTPEKEEILLSPMRMPRARKNPAVIHWSKDGNDKFDPSTLPADKVSLELEIGPSVMYLYGTWLLHLLHLKENIFGDDQIFTDMNESTHCETNDTTKSPPNQTADTREEELQKKEFDPREYRPLDVSVSITMHDIQGHIMKDCTEKDPPCPMILLERFGFEMIMGYKEMQLQLLLSPAILITTDKLQNRHSRDHHLNQGHLMLSGLQLRGHGLFSDTGRTLDQETLEYAWMLELQMGKLSGKLTSPQMYHVVTGLETLFLLMCDDENKFVPPRLSQHCLHGILSKECPESDADGSYRCPSSNDIKYRMMRFAVDAVDIYLVEAGTTINIWISPIRIAMCNLHSTNVRSGMSCLVPAIRVRQMIAANSQNTHMMAAGSNSNTNTTCSGRSQQHKSTAYEKTDTWLEVGNVSLGPLMLESALSLCNTDKNLHLVQHKFLKYHDEKFKKLWFLWPNDKNITVNGKCGCVGGAVFFGSNKNGQRFFEPSRQDVQDGINIAAFRINEPGKDPGFGQSILHDSKLVFHTPPYNSNEMSIYDQPVPIWTDKLSTGFRGKQGGQPSDNCLLESCLTDSSPGNVGPSTSASNQTLHSSSNVATNRRFSYSSSSNRNITSTSREVPYSRLLDTCPPILDSDTRLNTVRSILSVPETGETDDVPKSSRSDSKLTVDYFKNSNPQSPLSSGYEYRTACESLKSESDNATTASSKGEFVRAVSLTSENYSDAFFSAEEELYRTAGNSAATDDNTKGPSSSLRSSIISSPVSYTHDRPLQGKRFGSDFDILPENSKSHGIFDGSLSSRSDHEIHSPSNADGKSYNKYEILGDQKSLSGRLEYLRRSIDPSSSPLLPFEPISPKLKSYKTDDDDTLRQTSESGLLLDSSDSRSVSSTSFISAMSSQEDLTLVNLHMQVNKPIVDSPLLISTYVNHLSQVNCPNWNYVSLPGGSNVFTVPFFQRSSDGRLLFIASKHVPKFSIITEGFTSIKMVNRNPTSATPKKTSTHPWDSSQPDFKIKTDDLDIQGKCIQEELLKLRNETGTRTTIIVKMSGDIDIMVTPLVLESLQRFVDALTPTLSSLHPMIVLNHLHKSCLGYVEDANILKKDKYLSQLQGGGSKRSTVERIKTAVKDSTTGVHEPYSVYEEYIASQLQGTIVLPKINISVLQASVVEEMISFSALDNFRDLTCVSLLAVCFDDVTARFHYGKQAREVVQSFYRPTVTPSGQKKGVLSRAANKALLLGFHLTTTSGKDNVRGEPVYIETSEKQQEETVVTFNIGKMHAQLRRLRNECSILKDAEITAIPPNSSKVLFTSRPRLLTTASSTSIMDSSITDPTRISNVEEPTTSSTSCEDKLGFIMMELGFEGVSFKLVRRSKFEKEEEKEDNKDMNNADRVKSSPLQAAKEDKEQTAKQTNNGKMEGGDNTDPQTTQKKTKKPTMDTINERSKKDRKDEMGENASSCVIEVSQVWFNFAAPPRTPITRKIDYTRLDWNLLSTASPAINAWMNPSNRFAIRVVHMLRCCYRRNTSVITCLMAEALDIRSLHIPIKSRYGKLTPLAKTLQEDPSCQLCNILTKFLLESSVDIEQYLKDSEMPHLSILRQGVIVLSRQWKNILYTPLLLEHNFKSKRHAVKPISVTFAVPDPEEDNLLTDGDDCEVTDECAMLLSSSTAPTSTLQKVLSSPIHKYATGTTGGLVIEGQHVDLINDQHVNHTSPASTACSIPVTAPPRRKKRLLPTQAPSSSRASVVFPIASNTISYSPKHTESRIPEVLSHVSPKKDGLYNTLHSSNSIASLSSAAIAEMNPNSNISLEHASPLTMSQIGFSNGLSAISSKQGQREDLYTWMAKQGFNHDEPRVIESKVAKSTFWDQPKEETVTVNAETPSGSPDYTLMAAAGYSLYPMHDTLRLLDAHLIFQPLLSSLGVMPQQMITNSSVGNGVTSLDSWGSNLTLVGSMESARIDIVVSEFGKGTGNVDSNKKTKQKSKEPEKVHLDIPCEIPALLCERVSIECDLTRTTDMAVVEDLSRQRRNMLYVSRGQLKKHSNTVFNLSVSIRYISQQVNMPLLRLLHQISNMYQNVKDTQTELKGQQPPDVKIPPPRPPPPSVPSTTASTIDRNQYLINEMKSVRSPSSSIRTRHQSLAQRIRSTSRSVRGYMNLSEVPMLLRLPSTSEEKVPSTKVEENTQATSSIKCWKTVYSLLDLYATKPEMKTIHRTSIPAELPENCKKKPADSLLESKASDDTEKTDRISISFPQQPQIDIIKGEQSRLVVFFVAKIHRTKLLATLSALKLEAEITNLHASLTGREKVQNTVMEYSATGQVGKTMIVLLEGIAPNQQTVVKVSVGKSQALYSSVNRRMKNKNSALLTIGAVLIDIPQHPIALHGMMTRGTKQLSTTLQELRTNRTSSRMSRGATFDEVDLGSYPASKQQVKMNNKQLANQLMQLPEPLVMRFTAIIQTLSITASLLPSLQAQYKMDQLTSNGYTGNKAKFIIDLPNHSLSFSTKIQVTETNLPSEASIDLPKVHVSADYVQDSTKSKESHFAATDGAVLRQGNYLSAVADIGIFEHSLTTDLLNHLMFVQKVFMKEVNEVVQKVYGGEKPVAIWLEDTEDTEPSARILFSLILRVQRIQLTATTPTNCAVRLETGPVELQISNRVQNVSGASVQPSTSPKIFVKTQFHVNLSLGQLIRNVLFDEADPEFQLFAFFKTSIGLRNAFQGEMVEEGENKEVILISLLRPLIYIQPIAIDKAILVWLNYKNAYEYWNEQRSALNKEVQTATQPVVEKPILERLTSSSSLSVLFLQLTVEDMGICIPLNRLPSNTFGMNRTAFTDDSCAAVVITLESTSISACSSGSLVSKGRFIGLCLRFADDFETSLDDWKPDVTNQLAGALINFCSVSEGTYEVCSRTTTQKNDSENAKWFMNVQWQMEGVDIHLDVNIGKQLSALGHTLTMLTGVQEDDTLNACFDTDVEDVVDDDDDTNASEESFELKDVSLTDELPKDEKEECKKWEKEMNEQAEIINDLRSLGASVSTIEQETKRLQELEKMVFRRFRRDMIQKLRRHSMRRRYHVKDKLGLGNKGPYRSKSFILTSPTAESKEDVEDVFEGKVDETESKVKFADMRKKRRQVSLPSTSSDVSLSPDKDSIDWLSDVEDKCGNSSADEDPVSTNDSSTLQDLTSKEDEKSAGISHCKQQEPNIDFELDVKVFINSGKCVLHTKDQTKEEEIKMVARMKKERSASSGVLEFPPNSPNVRRKSKEKPPTVTPRLRQINAAQLADITTFHIPGLDVKVHYESRIIAEGGTVPSYTLDSSGIITRKINSKKASLFAWITLQSIPEETIISPHILEFLQQTLEPIPATNRHPFQFMEEAEKNINGEDDLFARYITSEQYSYASFPVDVIVYFHMQPSTFRFSCLPVSRVECMLKLPSFDIVFSSKRADLTGDEPCNTEGNSHSPVAVGGLSVTGVMSDFSLYIFHPYGGKKSGSVLKDAPTMWLPLGDGERKDSLSVNVEFVKFHLSRSRKLNFDTPSTGKIDQNQATIRFSTIVDIGTASFKYDMRRLTEILAFPKAWYKRNIIRRLFLGDLTNVAPVYRNDDDTSASDCNTEHENDNNEEGEFQRQTNEKTPKGNKGKSNVRRQQSKKSIHKGKKRLSVEVNSPKKKHKKRQTTAWNTSVLFAVNFNKLNVHMNMGNVMGNVTWLTMDFHSEGRLSIGSTGHKNMFIGLGFGGSNLDAKGGIVGGTIELSNIDTFILIQEEPGVEPDHTVGLKLFALELRLDYMGTGILMFRVSSLNITLRDEWKLTNKKSSSDLINSTKRPAMVFIHGDLSWDQLQVMVSKSTAVDLMKMYYKLDEFFSQQFKSSKRVFTSLQESSKASTTSSFRRRSALPKKKVTATLSDGTSVSAIPEHLHHHRHWQSSLLQVANIHLSTMKHALPSWGTVLGGTMDLHGSNISLACFHGINFKSKSWALFSLKDPSISFATEAQEVESETDGNVGLRDIHVIQTLTFSLGISPDGQGHVTQQQHNNSMATVCKVSRNVFFPPQFKTIQEWFNYAFSCSEIDAVDTFPSLEKLECQEGARCRTPKQQETVAHTREVIFALPSMQLHLKTEHLQPAIVSYLSNTKPCVDCSFITEFEDHIFVTVDAEAFFFLHDLITSYIKEKNRAASSLWQGSRPYSPSPEANKRMSSSSNSNSPNNTSVNSSSSLNESEERFSQDCRNFLCQTWHLEPTVRLLSWGGKSIEPYGVDYILQKLGFSHARTTIPKWMQRGVMDPLDKLLAILILRIIVMAKAETKTEEIVKTTLT